MRTIVYTVQDISMSTLHIHLECEKRKKGKGEGRALFYFQEMMFLVLSFSSPSFPLFHPEVLEKNPVTRVIPSTLGHERSCRSSGRR